MRQKNQKPFSPQPLQQIQCRSFTARSGGLRACWTSAVRLDAAQKRCAQEYLKAKFKTDLYWTSWSSVGVRGVARPVR